MKKLIFFIVFIALAIILIAQEIQHETIVVNIEVPVRVFDRGKFVENLTIDDFNVYEDGKLQDVVAVYLIKKTNIERKEIGAKEEEARIKFTPEVSRNFVLLFEIHEYLPKIGKAIEYFFEEVFLPGDTLKVVTPIKTYDFNVKSLERFTGKEIAKELIGQLRKDIKMSTAEYRSLLNDFENLMEFARTAARDVRTLVRKMYVDILAKLRNLRYIDEKKLLYFTDFLKNIDGPKHVFIFHQKLIVPVMRLSIDYTIEDLEDFEAYVSFDERKVKQAFSDSSISTHFIYLTKTSGTDLVNQEGVSVTSRGLLDTTSTTVPITETQDLSANFFSAFMEIAQTTGGTTDSSANAASSFKKAVNAAENYYLLYYRPLNYKEDGKFKNIKVRIKGKNFKVTHRAGYFAEKIDSSQPVARESKPVERESEPVEKETIKKSLPFINRGLRQYQSGDLAAAVEDFTRAIEIDPTNARAYYYRGLAFEDLEDPYSAVEGYTKAIEINPGYAEAYNNRGCLMVKEGNYEEAIKDFTSAIKIKPDYATAYFNRGNAWIGLGEYSNALKDFKKAVELDPEKREKASEKIKFCESKIKDK